MCVWPVYPTHKVGLLGACFSKVLMLHFRKYTGGRVLARRYSTYPGWQVLLLMLVLGAIIGGWLGEFILGIWPSLGILGKVQSVGLPTFVLDLRVFTLNFGFMLHISFFSLLGFLLAWWVYRRL